MHCYSKRRRVQYVLLDRNSLFLMELLVRLVFHVTASIFMKCINLSGMGAALWLVLHTRSHPSSECLPLLRHHTNVWSSGCLGHNVSLHEIKTIIPP